MFGIKHPTPLKWRLRIQLLKSRSLFLNLDFSSSIQTSAPSVLSFEKESLHRQHTQMTANTFNRSFRVSEMHQQNVQGF